jgi:WD40 repeat protein
MIKIWDANTGDVTLTLYGHTERIITVAFSLDGKRIVSAAFDGTVRTWDARSGQWPDDKAAN